MKKGWLIESCVIALSVVVLALCLKSGIDNFVNKRDSLSGIDEEYTKDKFIINIPPTKK